MVFFLKGFITNGGLTVLLFIIILFLLSIKDRKFWYDEIMKVRATIENRAPKINTPGYYLGGEELVKHISDK